MDPLIRQCRDAAMELLKPSKRDLERGLALHAESLVFESYGFRPNFAIDGDALKKEIEAGATDAEIADRIEEMSMTRGATDERQRQFFLDAFEASGVTCIFQNAGEEGNEVPRLIKRLARFTWLTDMLRDRVCRAATPDDIIAAKQQGRRCLYFSLNGVPLPMRLDNADEELGFIRIFFQLGARMAHLTYNRRNLIGDGCGESADAGLSDFGRRVVAEMNRAGMIVDVAHSGWRTSLEAAQVSAKPIVASHTACAALHRHIRGKPDEIIRAIVEKGGVVGICCIPAFLGGTGDIRAFLDHIDYMVRNFGPDSVAIGTDRVYDSPDSASEMAKLPALRKTRRRWESFWPAGTAPSDPKWNQPSQLLSTAWTNWPLFTVGLVQRGHDDSTIRAILGGNILRVCRESMT